ncbi:hypothetical protein ACQR22_01310 [Clostridium perfringens]|uniref:hypothetical protein n=1 Tax=Clostridium perfringens TaxID=1502 RepID=UPI001F563F08|nr:hypothetical protein [Clostridium perfringens]MCI2779166.1 hypothetical protein [Clostridium perfringens]
MNEYNVRKKTVSYINKNLDDVIERYCDIYKDNIGFLLYYPMIYLEEKFKDASPRVTNAIIDREITNWFVSEVLKRRIRKNLIFTFKKEEFEYYKNEIYPQLKNLYSDFRLAREINDDVSIEKCKVEKIDGNKYNIITSLILKPFEGGNAYFYGLHDLEERQNENELSNMPVQYILNNYGNKRTAKEAVRSINRLMIDIDDNLYKICMDRVNLDTSKMGESLKSQIINKKETLNQFLGFLFYISALKLVAFDIETKFTRELNYNNLINIIDIEWLKNKIKKITKMNEKLIEKYINYFIFEGEGTIVDFPLIKYRDNLIILPSSIMLNDWQFSISNGHHAKKIEFKKKEKNISKSIVDMIDTACKKFTNVLVAREYYYEVISDGKKLNSDIDVAICDINSNNILVIECKWKHNHYIEDIDENYAKIQGSLNKIYNEQISKHKEFLTENINNINKLFNHKIELVDGTDYNIYYLAVDKRSDLHIENQHMIAVYTLLALFNIYSESDTLDLEKLIKKIDEAKTKVEHYMIGAPKEFCIDKNENLYINSDELYGEFDKYFK